MIHWWTLYVLHNASKPLIWTMCQKIGLSSPVLQLPHDGNSAEDHKTHKYIIPSVLWRWGSVLCTCIIHRHNDAPVSIHLTPYAHKPHMLTMYSDEWLITHSIFVFHPAFNGMKPFSKRRVIHDCYVREASYLSILKKSVLCSVLQLAFKGMKPFPKRRVSYDIIYYVLWCLIC